jgi:hypothetical protein
MRKAALSLTFIALGAAASTGAGAHDYPTSERVQFVLECMRDHPGPEFEMVHKCSCALDRIAEELTHDAFVEGSTLAKAVSIAGERGSVLRDNEAAQADARKFRSIYRDARRKCMFRP